MELKTWRRYERIRALYERHPALYRLRLILLFLLGLTNVLFFLGWLLFFPAWCFLTFLYVKERVFTSAASLAGLQLLFPYLVGGFFLWRSLFVVFRRSTPDGMPLDPERCGRLYDEVREVCRELNVRPIRQIYLDLSSNAAVVSRFQWLPMLRRDTLVIGYPLICALDRMSFRVCLTRVLWHEKRSRSIMLNLLKLVWAIPPASWNPFTGEAPQRRVPHGWESTVPACFNRWLLPLWTQDKRAGDAYCRDAFGSRAFDAFLTQTLFHAEHYNQELVVLRNFSGARLDVHPAATIRGEIRKPVPEAEAKRLLSRMLRSREPVTEPIPPFRERVGTDDPAELLPYLERTPDAAEKILLSNDGFEAEFDKFLLMLIRARNEATSGENGSEDSGGNELTRLLQAENLDESSDNPDAWTSAAEAAISLEHADRAREILEKAVEKFPGNLSFPGMLLGWHLNYAETAEEEARAAAELERFTEQDSMLVLEFYGCLYAYAERRGDFELMKHYLTLRESALKANKKKLSFEITMDSDLEPCTDFPEMRESIAQALSNPFFGINGVYFATRRYGSHSQMRTYYIFLKRKNGFRRFVTGDSIPLSGVEELLSETPFHVSQATKQDLKVLEAKHIPFVKLK